MSVNLKIENKNGFIRFRASLPRKHGGKMKKRLLEWESSKLNPNEEAEKYKNKAKFGQNLSLVEG